ncbi:MAG: hypothetical protein H7255_20020 [Ramlibacter sp.]|nr:hypothetical protein [Ramlibacter sp.]
MTSAFDTFSNWARKTTSSFGELLSLPARVDHEDLGGGLLYRLKHWPDLPSEMHTAAVLRTLSVMSQRPVNRRWIMVTSRLSKAEVNALLKRLVKQDAVTVTDISHFPPAANADQLRGHAVA